MREVFIFFQILKLSSYSRELLVMIFERKGCVKSYIYIYINPPLTIRKTEAKVYSSPEPKEGSQFAGFFACH